jgi:hypothetical protein
VGVEEGVEKAGGAEKEVSLLGSAMSGLRMPSVAAGRGEFMLLRDVSLSRADVNFGGSHPVKVVPRV